MEVHEDEAGDEIETAMVVVVKEGVAYINNEKGVKVHPVAKTKVGYNVITARISGITQLSVRTQERRRVMKII